MIGCLDGEVAKSAENELYCVEAERCGHEYIISALTKPDKEEVFCVWVHEDNLDKRFKEICDELEIGIE